MKGIATARIADGADGVKAIADHCVEIQPSCPFLPDNLLRAAYRLYSGEPAKITRVPDSDDHIVRLQDVEVFWAANGEQGRLSCNGGRRGVWVGLKQEHLEASLE